MTNLINLALVSSRPGLSRTRFGYCSSVASVMSCSETPIPERIISDPSAATTLGYSRSKWVAEQICSRANNQTPLRNRVVIFRVGQLSGDSHKGVWNTKEAWPMMLSTVKLTKTLPDLAGESLDWLPVDTAATALVQGMASVPTSGDATDVLHVLNDNREPKWRQLLQWLQKEQDFAIVGPQEWVAQLERVQERNEKEHPAFKLLDHWKKAYGDNHRNEGKTYDACPFDMQNTKRAVPALRAVSPIDKDYFLKIWRWLDSNM